MLKFLFDIESKNHLVYNARVSIFSSEFYTGNGYIDYVDEDKKKHKIFLDKIFPQQMITKASGKVDKEYPLALSSNFNYYGDVRIESKDTNYLFNGYLQLVHNCENELAWMKFSTKIDPNEIYIPILNAPVSDDNQRMTSSILFNEKTLEPKTAFLTKDNEVNAFITQGGYLSYDKASSQYRISSLNKLQDWQNSLESYIAFNKSSCDAIAKGDINIGMGKEGVLKVNAYGDIKTNNTEKTAQMSMSFGNKIPIF